ncbi:MAG TPA: PqiC family protein [Acetobacteraceae bacterium]|nr:PqiC family protein [Acetobacteraceae bacterium]
MRGWLVAALAVACLAGCASPEPKLYTIATVHGPVTAGAPKVVLLRHIALAGFLDRQEIVRSSENYRLEVESNDWWGEPLGAMLGRVLVEELSQRLPGSSVYADSGAVSVSQDATVELNVQRLDADAAGNVVLGAQAAVVFERRRSAPVTRSFRIVVPQPGAGVPGEVAAISTAVGQLADGLATMLRR